MNINTTQALYLIKLRDVLIQKGVNTSTMLDQVGLSEADINDREQAIPIQKYLAAVEIAVAESSIKDLGFQVASHTHTLEHGVVGYAILSSATFREGLQRYVRYQQLQGPLLQVTVKEGTNLTHLVVTPLSQEWNMSDLALAFFVQEWLVTIRDWASMIEGIDTLFEGVSLSFSPLVQAQENGSEVPNIYQQYLNCPIKYNQAATQVSFPSEYLELNMDFGNKSIGNLCLAQCEGLLENLRTRDGLSAEIRKYLSNTHNKIPSMEEMANILYMSTRTLRRRLQSEDLTYQQLISDHRINMAKHYLISTDMSASGIAELVGYANAPNFYRAFVKEVGVTPKEFRLNS